MPPNEQPEKSPEASFTGNSLSNSGAINDAIVNVGSHLENVTQHITTINNPAPRQLTCPTPPPAPEQFGGRDTELTHLKQRLKSEETVAITSVEGLGGIGKTTVARQLAYDLYQEADCFRAVLWLDLTSNPVGAEDLLVTLAKRAEPEFRRAEGEELADLANRVKVTLQEAIDGKCKTCGPDRVLLVLDDVWENGLAIARQLKEVRPERCSVLVTTRFGQVSEALGATPEALKRLSKSEGAKLLDKYLLGAVGLAERERLSEVLGGHALALKLAAKRLPRLGKGKALLTHIEQYSHQLQGGADLAALKLESSEENLARSLSYSYASLNDSSRAYFRAIGVAVNDQPLDRGLLSALFGIEPEGLEEALEPLYLLGLLDEVGQGEGYGEGWYQMHPLLQAYARALLSQDTAEYSAVLVRYQEQVIDLAEQFKELPPEEWDQLNPYLPHILAVGDRLVEQTQAIKTVKDKKLLRQALAFALNTITYLYVRQDMQRDKWLEMGLAISRRLNEQQHEAAFLNALSVLYESDSEKALGYLQQALIFRRAAEDRNGEASILGNLGVKYSNMGEKERALDYYRQALNLFQRVGNKVGEATTLNHLGRLYSDLGEKGRVFTYYRRALSLYRAISNRNGEASILNNLGMVYSDLGEKEKALEYYGQALPLLRAVGNKGGEASILNNLGTMYFDLGEKKRPLEYYEQVLPLLRKKRSVLGWLFSPIVRIKVAYSILFLIGLVNILGGLVRELDKDSSVQQLDLNSYNLINYSNISYGVFHLIIGLLVLLRKSKIALLIGFLINSPRQLIMESFTFLSGNFSLINYILRMLILLGILQGWWAINSWQKQIAKQPQTIKRSNQRKGV